MMARVHLLRYLLTVFWHLPGSWKQRIRIVRKMGRSIRDYVSEGADVTYGQLVKRFGEPRQVGFTCVNEMETDELVKELTNKKNVAGVTLVTAIILVTLWIGYLGYCYIRFEDSIKGTLVISDVTVIERTETDAGGHTE